LNVTCKVFAKILCDRLLPHINAAVQHYQAGFQSDKSTTKQLFALLPVLLYGSETWVLTKKEKNQLLVFEREKVQPRTR
jgi:hypothetical protein